MKRLIILALIAITGFTQAQRSQLMGFVDSDVILGKMPEYQAAMRDLQDMAGKFEGEANQMKIALDQLQRDYLAEEVLLSNEQKKFRKEAIAAKEQELYQYREAKFGPNGTLVNERMKLVKPLQDKVYEAIQSVAKKEGYAFIFDKNGGALMLYADPKYDKTLEVMEALGITTTEDGPSKPLNGAGKPGAQGTGNQGGTGKPNSNKPGSKPPVNNSDSDE